MNKKQLYESIMKNVSQEIKKVLNENINNIDYFNEGAWKEMLKDYMGEHNNPFPQIMKYINEYHYELNNHCGAFAVDPKHKIIYFEPATAEELYKRGYEYVAVVQLINYLMIVSYENGEWLMGSSIKYVLECRQEIIDNIVNAIPDAKEIIKNLGGIGILSFKNFMTYK